MAAFVVPTIFKAVDKFTAPIKRMKTAATRFFKGTEAEAARLNRRLRKTANQAKKIAKTAFIVGAAIAAPLVLATREAIKFEDKMADVAKVLDFKVGGEKIAAIGDQAKDLAIFLARDTAETAGLLAALAQGGVAVEDLLNVGKIAGKVAVAFDVTAQEAGEAFVKIQNAMGGTISETERLMNAINLLSDTTASKAPEILTFMKQGGAGISRAMNASAESVAAFGAQLIATGSTAEEAATQMRSITRKILQSKPLTKIFDDAGQGAAGFLAILKKGKDLPEKQQREFFKQFDRFQIKVGLLAKNYDDLVTNIDNSTNATLIANSVQKEFANRQLTTAERINKLRAQVQVLSIEIGEQMIPILSKVITKISPIIKSMIAWARTNPELIRTIVKITAVLAGLAIAVGVISAAVAIFNLILLANPIVLIVIAVLALTVGIIALVKNWDNWKKSIAASSPDLARIVLGIQLIRKGWNELSEAISKNNLENGFRTVRAAIFDNILAPLAEVLKVWALITGSETLDKAFRDLNNFRTGLGVDVKQQTFGQPLDRGEGAVRTINPELARSESITRSIERKEQTIDINVKAAPGTLVSAESRGTPIEPTLSSTLLGF